jgi:hypothetical protein
LVPASGAVEVMRDHPITIGIVALVFPHLFGSGRLDGR